MQQELLITDTDLYSDEQPLFYKQEDIASDFIETNEYIYIGTFKEGNKLNGKLIYKNGTIYEGSFEDDNYHGYGHLTTLDGKQYNGQFMKGKKHGFGEFKWPDNSQYIGNYQNDIKSGAGEFDWPDGRIYKGQFYNGQPNGIGAIIVGKEIQEGIYVDRKYSEELTLKYLYQK